MGSGEMTYEPACGRSLRVNRGSRLLGENGEEILMTVGHGLGCSRNELVLILEKKLYE